jgi:hypothetical protein
VIPTTGGPYKLTDTPTGTVNTAGTAVTSTGGINFAAVAPLDSVNIAGVQYTVASVQGVGSLTLKAPGAGTQTGVPFSDGPIEQAASATAVTAIYGPSGPSGTGNPPYFAIVANLTTLVVTAGQHGQGSHPSPICLNAQGEIACKALIDGAGNVTYSWPRGFTGAIAIYGGGTGPQGPQGQQGPQGIQGIPGVPTPPSSGVYCLQTANGVIVYVQGICGAVSAPLLSILSNADLFNLSNFQLALMTNGPAVPLSLLSLTNGQLATLSGLQLALLTN